MKTILAVLILAVSLGAQAARDVTEFTLFKRNEPTQIGQVGLTLKSTDTNKQRFSIDVLTDGHRIEKKDQDIRIPIYFYVGANSQPHELVVMKVAPDQVVGRLAGPK